MIAFWHINTYELSSYTHSFGELLDIPCSLKSNDKPAISLSQLNPSVDLYALRYDPYQFFPSVCLQSVQGNCKRIRLQIVRCYNDYLLWIADTTEPQLLSPPCHKETCCQDIPKHQDSCDLGSLLELEQQHPEQPDSIALTDVAETDSKFVYIDIKTISSDSLLTSVSCSHNGNYTLPPPVCGVESSCGLSELPIATNQRQKSSHSSKPWMQSVVKFQYKKVPQKKIRRSAHSTVGNTNAQTA